MAAVTDPTIRVRMAPSPTGPLHIGGVRTALFNWLFARKNGGVFVLRVEDTDKERSEKRYEEELLAGFAWLGLDWDEGPLPMIGSRGSYGPYRQSERTEIYKKYLSELLEKGDVYRCYCSKEDLEAQRQAMLAQGLQPKYNGHCRNLKEPPIGKNESVIRFKVPETNVEFKDMVRGKVTFDTGLFGDIVIAKNLEEPLYNFAVVVDDELMKISHVIRGEEHLSNTPKQILLQRALGFKEPIYAHIPLILNADRSKMSKRFADTALAQYREKGYLPEALINFLALLGWHPKGDQEVMSIKELIKEFDLERVQKAGAIFNEEKLNWLNREHMKALSDKAIATALEPLIEKEHIVNPGGEAFLEKVVAVERSRANTLQDLIQHGKFFFELPEYDHSLLAGKDSTPEEAKAMLKQLTDALGKLNREEFSDKAALTNAVKEITGERKRGVVLWPLRVALSGLAASPDPIDIMTVLGKEESVRRLMVSLK